MTIEEEYYLFEKFSKIHYKNQKLQFQKSESPDFIVNLDHSFGEIEIDLSIKSDFSKVFILRTKKDELIELK